MQQREAEWAVGIVFAAAAAAVLVIATSFIESTALRLFIFALALVVTALAAMVMDIWVSADPREGMPTLKEGFVGRTVRRLRERDWLVGVLLLWVVAAAAIGVLALFPIVAPVIVVVAVLAILAAMLAFLWGDFTPAVGPGRPPAT